MIRMTHLINRRTISLTLGLCLAGSLTGSMISPSLARCHQLAPDTPPAVEAAQTTQAVLSVLDPTDFRLEETLTLSFRNRFKAVLNEARNYLEANLTPNAAVVLDLDETVMDNRAYFIIHKRYVPDLWDRWVLRGEAPAIPETLDFIRWLRDHNAHVYFITGRKEHLRNITVKNLTNMGISEYDGLYMKPNDYEESSASNFKIKARQDIEAKGQPVVLILGDQESDIRGGYGEGFKLPNPIYTIP